MRTLYYTSTQPTVYSFVMPSQTVIEILLVGLGLVICLLISDILYQDTKKDK